MKVYSVHTSRMGQPFCSGKRLGIVVEADGRGFYFIPEPDMAGKSRGWRETYEAAFPKWTGGLDRTESKELGGIVKVSFSNEPQPHHKAI